MRIDRKSVSHGNTGLATNGCVGAKRRAGPPMTGNPAHARELKPHTQERGSNLSDTIIIALPFDRKAEIAIEAYHAIKRAVPIIREDRLVAAYAAAPHEGITPELVAHIRSRMIKRGELPARAFSRRGEAA